MPASPFLFRLLSAALVTSLFLPSVAAFDASSEAPQPVPAAAASFFPLTHVPEDPAFLYRSAAQRLGGLGLTQAQVNVLWARFGPSLSAQLDSGALSPQVLDILLLPFSRPEKMPRYLSLARDNPQLSLVQVVTRVNMGLDRDFYTGVEPVPVPEDPQVLVNKYHVLSPDYVPQLVGLAPAYGSGSLAPQAADAFVRMADAARKDGVRLVSVSAYRSYQAQAELNRRYAARYGQAVTDTFSARAGYSEHQTGLALDINTANRQSNFQATPEFDWLSRHCAQFGFLLRYPQGKEAVTGYTFEPWHYRYVGIEAARVCTDQGLTYEEYQASLPVPAPYQVPALFYQGEAVDLDHRAVLLDATPYLSAARLAPALGWLTEGEPSALTLSNGHQTVSLTPGRSFSQDGRSMRLIRPALEVGGELYLSLPDVCAVMGLDLTASGRGLELTPCPVWPTVVSR